MNKLIILFLMLLSVSTTKAVVLTDSLVLMEIMRQNPGNTLSWDTTGSAQLTNWEGVTVGSDGRVSLLWIGESNITILPSTFGNLDGLQNFSARENNLTSLPASFTSLSKLANCNLGNNNLTSLPSDFGNLTAMKYLYLTNNILWRGTFPSNFFNMTGLYILHIGGNGKNFLTSEVGNMRKLSELITDCSDQTSIPNEISNLPNLSKVGIYGYDLTEIPAPVFGCENLESLEIGGPDFTTFPSDVSGLTNLVRLTLRRTSVTALPSTIGNLKNLKYLWLEGNKLSYIPPEIRNLPALQILDIRKNEFTIIPEYFFQNPNMYEIRADSNNISSIATISSATASSSKVGKLLLAHNNLSELPNGFQNLKIYNLNLSNNQFSTISNIPPYTSTLTLDSNNLSTFPSSLVGHSKLMYLYMRDNNITSLPMNLASTPGLRRLDLTNNKLTSIPSDIGNIQFMLALKLGGNRIASIPTGIGDFVYIDTLQFDNNYFPKTFIFPTSITNLKNRELTLWMNSLMKSSQVSSVIAHFDSIAPGWQAPLYTSAPMNDTIEEGETFSFTIAANDEDGDNINLRYSFVDSIAGMTLNSYTGTINFTATAGDVGTHTITVRTLDEYRAFNDTTFTIQVGSGTIMPAKVTSGAYDLTKDRGDTAVFYVTVSGGLPITYQWQKLASGQSTYTNIADANSDTLIIYPVEIADIASYRCIVSNSEGKDTSSVGNLSVINKIPVLAAVSAQTINEDESISINLSMMTVSDEDDSLTDSSIRILNGLNYSVSGNNVIPKADWNGILYVPVYVVDGIDGSTPSDTLDMAITVNPVNDVPLLITSFTDTTIKVGNYYVSDLLIMNFNDIDIDDSLILTVSGLPSGFSITDGKIVGSSSVESNNDVIVTATDDSLASISDTFAFNVVLTTSITEVNGELDSDFDGIIAVPNIVTKKSEKVNFLISDKISGVGTITVFDLLGNIIDSQSVNVSNGGHYMWDIRNKDGIPVASGLYIVQLQLKEENGSTIIQMIRVGVKE